MGYESLRNDYDQTVLKENQMDIMNWDPGGIKKEKHKNLVIGWIRQSGEILNVDKKNWEEELRNHWGNWLTEDWYREVILFCLFREVEGDISGNVGKREKEFWGKRVANFCLMGKGGIIIHDQEEMGPYLIFVERDGS
jgi:hypothetical protein